MKNIIKRLPPIRRILDERENYYRAVESTSEMLTKERSKNRCMEENIVKLETSISELHEELSKLKVNILDLEKEKSCFEKNLADKQLEKIELESKIADLIIEIEEFKTHNVSLNNNLHVLKEQNSKLLKEINILNGSDEPLNSKEFWENRYKSGLNSGTGSYSKLADFKAKVINEFIAGEKISKVIEFGCGDGNQLSLMKYQEYVGIDVSNTVIENNKKTFKDDKSKKFYTTNEKEIYLKEKYELSISLDVIFHLTEDHVYEEYMIDLFNSSDKYIIVYSSNHEEYTKWPEFRHRKFMRYIQNYFKEWSLYSFIPNEYPFQFGFESTTSSSDFYIFIKNGS